MHSDEQVFDYFGIDPMEFKDMKKRVHHAKKEEKKMKMVSGEIQPSDKNFFELKTDDRVFVRVSLRTPVIEGRIRMAYANDSYVIEHDEDGILTWDMMVPNRKITSHKPYIFDISLPNHHKVFRTKKDLEMSSVDFLIHESKKSHIPLAILIEQIKEMLDKYPEEFI